jgi:hypothetical protein
MAKNDKSYGKARDPTEKALDAYTESDDARAVRVIGWLPVQSWRLTNLKKRLSFPSAVLS